MSVGVKSKDHGARLMLHELVESLVTDCEGPDAVYALEHVVPSLIPALVDLLKRWEEKEKRKPKNVVSAGTQLKFNPCNFLAQHLYRNNPRVNHSGKTYEYQALVKDIIHLEKRAIRSVDYQARLREDTEKEVNDLNIWPKTEQGDNEFTIKLYGKAAMEILNELEWQTGLVGLRSELQIAFETIDVCKGGSLQWDDFIAVTHQWVTLTPEKRRAKSNPAFRAYLRKLVRAKLDEAVENYYQSSWMEVRERRSFDQTVKFMEEIRQHVLNWGRRDFDDFQPQDIMDEYNIKYVAEPTIIPREFIDIVDSFLDKLADARVSYFANL